MQDNTNAPAILAIIREAECVGCTKCIESCPVDAIVGSANLMHSVIADECIGCKLCVPACPVDCIDLITAPKSYQRPGKAHIQARHQARAKRLHIEEQPEALRLASKEFKQDYILNALKRAKKTD